MVIDDVYSVGLVVGFYVWVDGVEVADYGGGVLDLLLLVISLYRDYCDGVCSVVLYFLSRRIFACI